MNLATLSGVRRRLKAWGIVYKQGRIRVTSPDPAYDQKLAMVERALHEARIQPQAVAFLYQDEKTVYRRASVGYSYGERGSGGSKQPSSDFIGGANTKFRIAGALDAMTGKVISKTGSKVGIQQFCGFLEQIRREYGPDIKLYLAMDNWPVHHHEEVKKTAERNSISILYLPTYAPWTNPIEKLWKKLETEILKLHRYSSRWEELREMIRGFLKRFNRPSPDLLSYIGLG